MATTLMRPPRPAVYAEVMRAEAPHPLSPGYFQVDETVYRVAVARGRERLLILFGPAETLAATLPIGVDAKPSWVYAGLATRVQVGELLADPEVCRAAYRVQHPTACWCCGIPAKHLDATGRADRCAKGTCTCATRRASRQAGRRRGRRGRR